MTSNADDLRAKRLARIKKLLALYGDPRTDDAERESAAAFAAELMTRAGIDEAEVRAAMGEAPEGIEIYPLAVSGAGGYGEARAMVAYFVAEALGCKSLIVHTPPAPRQCMMTTIGAASDVATLRTLLPLVLVQAERAALAAIRDKPGRRRLDFMTSFLHSYGQTIAERIARRRQSIGNDPAAAAHLADRAARVQALFDAKFPNVRARSARIGTSGLAAGARAANSADLGDGMATGRTAPALAQR